MWERKANTATVITQDWVLIVESLFPTFVKTTTGKKSFADSLNCTSHTWSQTKHTVDFITKHFQPRVSVCLV